MAVAIVINKGASCTIPGPRGFEPGLGGDVRKGSVAVVVIQDVLAKVGQEEVIVAVVVVISDADAVAPARVAEPCLVGHVGESAIAIVVIEVIRGFAAGREPFVLGAVQQENVEPAVLVVVIEGDPAAVGFHDVLLLVLIAVNQGSGKTRARRDIREGDREGLAGRLGARGGANAS